MDYLKNTSFKRFVKKSRPKIAEKNPSIVVDVNQTHKVKRESSLINHYCTKISTLARFGARMKQSRNS